MSQPIILVTGSNGQLGKELKEASGAFSAFDFLFVSREELPLQETNTIIHFFETYRPAYCINCAAYTAVDKAETEVDRAFLINGESVGNLASVCEQFATRLVHISTDYVFDGSSATPLREDDPTNPINIYGASKLLGEQLALKLHADTIIVRTSWVYSEFGNNFVKTMIRLMREKDTIGVINDQVGSPTYASDLAIVILRIIGNGKFIPGIYNYSNEGQISWFDFAVAIRELTGSPCTLRPIPASQYPTPARRPHYSLLDKAKIREVYNADVPDWKDSLIACIGKILSAQG